jgi:hypothetical protein
MRLNDTKEMVNIKHHQLLKLHDIYNYQQFISLMEIFHSDHQNRD